MSGDKENGFNVARAELFEAMGHPNRIRIIKALEENPLGFSELKRAVGIESSGLLVFHLDKLTHLVATDSSGNYALTDEGREALKIIQTTTDESIHGNGKRGPRRIERRNVVLAAVVIAILVLASFAIYQQSELSGLSRTNSSQSSELVSPAMDVVLSNFTVTMVNSTAAPVLFLYLQNVGQAPASSASILASVSGQSTFQSCFTGNANNFFPVYSHDTAIVSSRLSCGQLGNGVTLTAQVNFLTSQGNVTKTFSAQTTIVQSQFKISTVMVGELGIRTFVTTLVAQNQTVGLWYFTLTNVSPTPIISVRATLGTPNNPVGTLSGCVLLGAIPGNDRPVSSNTPMTQFKSCSNDGNVPAGASLISVGESYAVTVYVTYSNGTAATTQTTAMMNPAYVLFQ